jgi:8-oxo-dGTP pyrophosphatase MutT (NUDIX family)
MGTAVCLAIFSRDKKLLLTRRSMPMRQFAGAWVMPGGHLDPGETFEGCAMREVEEEVGIDVSQYG